MANNNPKVSIITSAYNHGRYIEKAVESVISQTYQNWEYIIIDDGSSDDTVEKLHKYQSHPKIRIIVDGQNKGQSVRMNQGIDQATGEFIAILPSDDWYLPDKLKLQVEKFATLSEEYGVVYGAGQRYFESNNEIKEAKTNHIMQRGWILEQLLTGPFFVYPITPLFRKECFDIYRFNESYMAEGEAIHFKMAIKFKYDYVDHPLAVMREHQYNTGGRIEMMMNDNVRYRQELFALPEFPSNLKKILPDLIAKIYSLKGWELLRLNGDKQAGRNALLSAIKTKPLKPFKPRIVLGLLISWLPNALFKQFVKTNNT